MLLYMILLVLLELNISMRWFLLEAVDMNKWKREWNKFSYMKGVKKKSKIGTRNKIIN